MFKIFPIVMVLLFMFSANLKGQHYPFGYRMGKDINYKISDENPSSNSISDIVTYGDYVFIGSSRGLSISSDRGNNWTNFYGNSAFGTESVSAVGFDTLTGILWAATAHSVERDGQSLPEGSGLKFTSDFGLSWNFVPQPIDDPNDTIEVYGINQIRALPVTVAIQNLIYDIAFTPGTIWIATFAGGLRRSTDLGVTWDRVVIPPDKLDYVHPDSVMDFCLQPVAGKFCAENNLNHRVFSVISAGDSILFAGTAGGINRSTDGGVSWVKFNHQNQLNSISGNFVVALGYNPADSSVWGATWKAEDQAEFYGVSQSKDLGENWMTFLPDEKVHNFGYKETDVIAAADNGAFRSSDSGNTWILPGNIIDKETGIPLSTNIFYSASSNGNIVWLGSGDGLVKLTQTGNMWNGDWKVYFASQKLTSATESYAYPNPFSPKNEVLKIKYSTGGKQSDVTIRIFDFGMNYIRTVIQNAPRGNPYHVVDQRNGSAEGVIDYWDGRDDSGSMVPNGVYFYRVEVGGDDPVYGKILVLQ